MLLVKRFHVCKKPTDSLLHSQKTATGLYYGPVQSGQYIISYINFTFYMMRGSCDGEDSCCSLTYYGTVWFGRWLTNVLE
jgi:hypothetical protein